MLLIGGDIVIQKDVAVLFETARSLGASDTKEELLVKTDSFT